MNCFKNTLNIIIVSFLLSSCFVGKSTINNTKESVFPYVLSDLVSYELDSTLNEISGLCYDDSKDVILAVEDEHGILFTLDKSTGSVLQRDSFYKNGDYEGIAISENYVFVLKSTGTIYKVDKQQVGAQPLKVKSFLNKKYDVEGVDYDKANQSLLICHKESTGDVSKNQRCVFRYDLQSEQMIEEPLITINRAELLTFIKENYSKEYAQEKFKKIVNPNLDYLHLGPSAIAMQPKTNDIYILSSRSKALLIYDVETKKLKFIQKLDKKIFRQPEGICFDKDSNLYISSEAKGEAARLIFVPKEN